MHEHDYLSNDIKCSRLIMDNIAEFGKDLLIDYTHFYPVIDYFIICYRYIIECLNFSPLKCK